MSKKLTVDSKTGEIIETKKNAFGVIRRRFTTDQPFDPKTQVVTQQQFKDECDVNKIIARFGDPRLVPNSGRPMSFGDFSDPIAYQDALQLVIDADYAFSELSSEIRDRFANDPSKFLAFMSNSENRDEAIKLGIVVPPAPTPEAPPQKVQIVNPEPPKA